MKINKYKLLKLKFIKTKSYKKNYYETIKLEKTLFNLKKSFLIIYKYHVKNKKIVFVGFPLVYTKKLNNLIKKTNHFFIPSCFWINGILTNKKNCFQYMYTNPLNIDQKTKKFLSKMEINGNLMVIFDTLKNNNALNEAYKVQIPIISANINLIKLDNKSDYQIPGNFNFIDRKIRNNFLLTVLYTTIKKV
jgi:ribosomal protein S2